LGGEKPEKSTEDIKDSPFDSASHRIDQPVRSIIQESPFLLDLVFKQLFGDL
jgi:hypothetical protein